MERKSGVYRWDSVIGEMIKVSDRPYRRSASSSERPLRDQVMEGYRKVEARGERINGSAPGINRIWSK